MRGIGPVENIVRTSIQFVVRCVGARRTELAGGMHFPRFDLIACGHLCSADCLARQLVSERQHNGELNFLEIA